MPRSGWFWQTSDWAEYERHYGSARIWKSSPLDNDHDLSDLPPGFALEQKQSQVIDLGAPIKQLWAAVGYRNEINQALRDMVFEECPYWTIRDFHRLHAQSRDGQETRCQATWDCNERWLQDGKAVLVMARVGPVYLDGAFFILHKNGAYYASAPKCRDTSTHKGVIWSAIKFLKWRNVRFLEMGDVTPGETNPGLRYFKSRFGGEPKPYQIARGK